MLTSDYLLDRIQYDTNGGCWLWALSCGDHGYGQIVYRGRHDLAHRASWRVHKGAIPDGIFVLHRCDTRPCIRPDHLFLGDARANTADMIAKSRQSFPPQLVGAANLAAKLSEAEVLEIRRLYEARSATQTELARQFGVSQTMICDIVRRKNWRHI